MSDLMSVIDRAAKISANGVIIRTLDPHERYEIAWSACAVSAVEHYNETGEVPDVSGVVKAGLDAVGQEQWRYAHDRGIGVERGHAIYWDRQRDTAPHPESVVDPVALLQVLNALSEQDREVIEQVAVADSLTAAADMRGESYATTAAKYRSARGDFYALWFEGQNPPRVPQPRRRYQRKDRCVEGHPRTPDNVYRSGGCKVCGRAQAAARRAA